MTDVNGWESEEGMDWIETCLEKWKRRLKNHSLWKSLAVYLILAVLVTISAVGLTLMICQSWRQVILSTNGIPEGYHYIGEGVFAVDYVGNEGRIVISEPVKSLANQDKKLFAVLGIVEAACIPFYTAGAILLVSFLYYRNKLKEPIFLLREEMAAIRRDDLSFSCRYDSTDEMGEICAVMDSMRLSVLENQQNVWEILEEQRKINAAFAHDLRTPLTVINGYVEMLYGYYERGEAGKQQLVEMLLAIQKQTKRIQAFSETMKEVHNFETLTLKKKWHTREEFSAEVGSMINGLMAESGLSITVSVKMDGADLYYDENVIAEVMGNLLSNAVRYADKQIEILAERNGDFLFVYVKDDGRGMTPEELYKADSPYYSDKMQGESIRERDGRQQQSGDADGAALRSGQYQETHFGMGLTICKILCKKHGGKLALSNSMEGGAIVCAQFFVG